MREVEREIAAIADELEAQLGRVPAVFEGRSEVALGHHATADGWCAKQVLGHLIEAEGEVFTMLILGLLGREVPPEWDRVPSMVRGECAADTSALLARWKELRRGGIALARSLTERDLGATSDRNWHGGESETVGALLRHWPRHTDTHARQAEQAISNSE